MKGATALPLARTMRAPNTASMRMMGRSQYFLRTRMKLHSSAMKSIMTSSELPGHRVGRRARRMPLDPVGDGIAVKPKPQRILAEQAAHEADGGHSGIEHQAHDHRADAGMEEQPEPEPEPAKGRKHPGEGQSGHEEGGRDDQSPVAHRSGARAKKTRRGPKRNRRRTGSTSHSQHRRRQVAHEFSASALSRHLPR